MFDKISSKNCLLILRPGFGTAPGVHSLVEDGGIAGFAAGVEIAFLVRFAVTVVISYIDLSLPGICHSGTADSC